MGIQNQNFTQYIDKRIGDLKVDYKLEKTKVVIDSTAIKYVLYGYHNRKSIPFDIEYKYGGNYQLYVKQFDDFFTKLKYCRIEPILVTKGLNWFEESRRNGRFDHFFYESKKNYEKFKEGKSHYYIIYPIFLHKTFDSVIKRLAIPHFQTVDLSDAAKLANDLKCPLISYDDNHYCMKIDNGVIHCLDFVKGFDSIETNNSSCIDCKIYRINDFVKKFDGLTSDMLPIFAILMKHDFIDKKFFNEFLLKISERIFNQKNDLILFNEDITEDKEALERWDRMDLILNWLSRFRGDFNEVIN